MLLHPNGNEEVLVNAGTGSVTDPFVSFDGQWVYYSYFYEPGNINSQRGLPYGGADIFKIHLGTKQVVVKLKANVAFNTGVTYRIRINLNSGTFTVSVDGVVVVSGSAQGNPFGAVGFRIKDATASFKEITVF